jgi:hypothetical protein
MMRGREYSQPPYLLEIFECDASPTGGADHLSSWCVVIVFVLYMRMSARKITAFFPLSLQSHRVTHLHTHRLEPRPCHAHSSRKVPKRIGSSFTKEFRAYERCRRWQELSRIWCVRSRVLSTPPLCHTRIDQQRMRILHTKRPKTYLGV